MTDDVTTFAIVHDFAPVEADTVLMFITPLSFRGEKLTQLMDHKIAVHRFEYGPVARIEIASGKLTKQQKKTIIDHAASLGLPVVSFSDTETGNARRAAFPARSTPHAGKYFRSTTPQ